MLRIFPPPMMENQSENKMENEMEVTIGGFGLGLGFRLNGESDGKD